MATTDIGRAAEELAAEHLEARDFQIIDRNWRTRWCEIDLVARKSGIVHFIEVKYRKTADFGGGFEYITADKQRRLARAANFWLAPHRWNGDWQIDAVAVT